MKIGLLSLQSDLAEAAGVRARWQPFWRELAERVGGSVTPADPERADEFDLYLVNAMTGGTERKFVEALPRLRPPVRLLSASFLNSLPASEEMLAFARRQGVAAELVHGTPEHVAAQLKSVARVARLHRRLAGARAGIVGGPSDWLIASEVSSAEVAARYGVVLLTRSMEELLEDIRAVNEADARAQAGAWRSAAAGLREATPGDLLGAARMYLGLRVLCARHDLKAVTVRCFDLLTALKNTGCMALSQLNDEGLVAGCEGDVPALVSMMMASSLAETPAFMANIADVSPDGRELWLAHCTIAGRLTRRHVLRSHFESGRGVAIQGELAEGPVTIFRLGRPGLDHAFLCGGELQENTDFQDSCRTQVRIRLPRGTDYFHHRPLGNHHVLAPGDLTGDLRRFLEESGATWESA